MKIQHNMSPCNMLTDNTYLLGNPVTFKLFSVVKNVLCVNVRNP